MLWVCAVGLLLGLSPAQPAPRDPGCGGTAQNLPQPVYNDTVSSAKGSVSPFVHSFLGTVQPKPFPQELIKKFIDDVNNEENIREVVDYEMGFLVCAAIGLVYAVLMPLVGLVVACCRCRGRCGGKMHQEQVSSITGRRRILYWCTFVTTVFIMIGNIFMFEGNDDFRDSLHQSPVELHNNLKNMDTFLSAVPKQLDHVVDESSQTVNEVKKNIDDVGPVLGRQIQNQVAGVLNKTTGSVGLMDQEAKSTDGQLTALKTLLNHLELNVDKLKADVSDVKTSVQSRSPCTGCAQLDLATLDQGSLSVPTSSLDGITSSVNQIKTLDLQSKIQTVDDFYNDIPNKVTEKTLAIVGDTKKFLNDIDAQVSSVKDKIPLAQLSDVSLKIEDVQIEIRKHVPFIEHVDSIRWKVSLAVCFSVLMVVVSNFLGLLLGPIGLQVHEDPTKRSFTADCGGILFLMGAGFSFIFSWLLMSIVVVLFVVGGNSYTLGCKPWDSGEVLKFADAQYKLGPMLGLKTNLTFSGVYGDCKDDKSVWSTFHLNETINLDDLLNVTKYTGEIQDIFNKTDITLDSITILADGDKTQLTDLSNTATSLNMSGITQEMDRIYEINLNETADGIDAVAVLQADAAVKAGLQQDAAELRKIQSWVETTIYPQMKSINSNIQKLQSSTATIKATVGQVLDHVDDAQNFLNTDMLQLIKDESKTFLHCQLGYFEVLADWAKATITKEMGRCGQLAKAVQSLDTIVCSQLVDSMVITMITQSACTPVQRAHVIGMITFPCAQRDCSRTRGGCGYFQA